MRREELKQLLSNMNVENAYYRQVVNDLVVNDEGPYVIVQKRLNHISFSPAIFTFRKTELTQS